MNDYLTMHEMLSRGIKAMKEGKYSPVLTEEANSHEDILVVNDHGYETWYYFDKKTHALSCIRVYGK